MLAWGLGQTPHFGNFQLSKPSARNRQTDRNNVIQSVTCILSYPSGQKQPPKRDIIGLKFQGVLAMQNTISIHVGNISSIIHNNRKTENHTNPDIDVSRSGDNITLVQENIKDSYEKLFGQAVDEYNAKQKRADRKINNYLQKVKDSALDHQKEFIMQIGDYQSLEKVAEEQGCKVWETQEWQLRAETLKQAVLDFQVQNPNLYVYNAVIHLDELNPHAHINFIPVGDNMKKGLSKQVSMNRALENMGYDAKFEVSSEAKNVKERGRIKLDNSKNFKNWRDDNLERVKEIAKEVYQKAGHKFEFIEGDKSQQHESVQAYKKIVEAAKEKSKEIIEQAEIKAETSDKELREESYDLWEKDWDKTEKEMSDFKFDYLNEKVAKIAGIPYYPYETKMLPVRKTFPRAFNLSVRQVFNLLKEKYSQVKDYIASKLQYLSHRETEIEKKENTLTESYKRLEMNLDQFEEIKHNFDELIDDINPESQFNKNIDDAFVALECYDKALKEEDWIKLEDYPTEDEMWREVYSEYTLDQNFSIRANAKMTWEDNLLRGVTRKGFIHEIKNKNGQIERGIPWTRLEIKSYLKQQIEERAKLKFDISDIKENIAEQRTNLLRNGLDRGHGMSL